MHALILMLCCIVPRGLPEVQVEEIIHRVHTNEGGWIEESFWVRDGDDVREAGNYVAKELDGYRVSYWVLGVPHVAYSTQFRRVTTKDHPKEPTVDLIARVIEYIRPCYVLSMGRYQLVAAKMGRAFQIVLWKAEERVIGIGLNPFGMQIGALTDSMTLW